jgi:hypothetical protein
VVLLLLLLLVLLLASAYRAAWRWAGSRAEGAPDITGLWRRREQERARRRERARQLRLPPLPAEDAPPANLTPLVPSPRTVRVEAARGIREIEDWLADQTAA